MVEYQSGDPLYVSPDATDNTPWPLFGEEGQSYGFDYLPPFKFVDHAGDGDLIVEDSTGAQMEVSPEFVHPAQSPWVTYLQGFGAEPVDWVNHPPHYQTESGLEAVDVIEAFGLGWHLGSAAKYILRAGKKGDFNQDIDKAIWFLERAKHAKERGAL